MDSLEYKAVDPKDVVIERITLYESWETVNGTVYHKWRKEGETNWHWEKTPHKEPPVVFWKHVTPIEYDAFYKGKDDGEPEGTA